MNQGQTMIGGTCAGGCNQPATMCKCKERKEGFERLKNMNNTKFKVGDRVMKKSPKSNKEWVVVGVMYESIKICDGNYIHLVDSRDIDELELIEEKKEPQEECPVCDNCKNKKTKTRSGEWACFKCVNPKSVNKLKTGDSFKLNGVQYIIKEIGETRAICYKVPSLECEMAEVSLSAIFKEESKQEVTKEEAMEIVYDLKERHSVRVEEYDKDKFELFDNIKKLEAFIEAQ